MFLFGAGHLFSRSETLGTEELWQATAPMGGLGGGRIEPPRRRSRNEHKLKPWMGGWVVVVVFVVGIRDRFGIVQTVGIVMASFLAMMFRFEFVMAFALSRPLEL